jgi:hypothetical protein
VWFNNIKAMLELKIDNSLKWMDVPIYKEIKLKKKRRLGAEGS